RSKRDWSSDVCSSDLNYGIADQFPQRRAECSNARVQELRERVAAVGKKRRLAAREIEPGVLGVLEPIGQLRSPKRQAPPLACVEIGRASCREKRRMRC